MVCFPLTTSSTLWILTFLSVSSCEYTEVKAQLAVLLGLYGTEKSAISITSIASFAAHTDTNTETAYKQFRDGLYRIGVANSMVRQNKDKILEILRSQSMVASIQTGGSDIEDKDQGLEMAYEEYCLDLYRIGFTDDMILQQKDRILGILRSRRMAASSNTEVKDNNSSPLKDLPSFRLTSQVNWFDSSTEAGTAPLDTSASHSHTGIVELVFGKGSSSTNQENTSTPLHAAAWDGYTWLAELLLGRTPLPKGRTGIMELLFSKDVSIDASNGLKSTPLHYASICGHTDIVDLLLSKGASVETVDHWGETPLHLAAQRGHTGIVELLLKQGASTEAKAGLLRHTPLHFAAEKGHLGIVKLLLKHGASTTARSLSDTPIHNAIKRGHTEIVELLLEQGTSIEAKGHLHYSLINTAARHGHTNIMDLLLKGTSSIEDRNGFLLLSAVQSGTTGVVELLLEKGVPVNPSRHTSTPLQTAARRGHNDVVRLLLEKGASLEATDYRKMTPLHEAAEKGHTNIVKLLLEEGASLEAKNREHRTPLHEAAKNGHTDTVKLLLEEGASIEAKDQWRKTPLSFAEENSHSETAKFLRKKAAELRYKR